MKFLKIKSADMPTKPKPTEQLPNNLMYVWDPNANDWIILQKDTNKATPPLYDPNNQNVATNTTTYMSSIKSSSSLSVLPKLLDKVWYDYDEETAGKYAQIGSWEIGLGGYDTGYEVSYNGTPIFSITEDNELKPYMSDDRLQKDFGFSYSDVEKALKKHRDLENIKIASVIDGEEDENPLSVKLSDLFLSDSSLVDSYIKKEISCNDILNILGIKIKNENEYKEVCNYVNEFINDNYMSNIKFSCLSKFLDGPRYSKEIKIESGLIKEGLVKYAGFDFNRGTKYAITDKGLEVLRKASEKEHNEALNEREKLAYMFGFNTDKETTLDTTGKVIKSDELSKCEWCGEEFDESELEDTELGKVCYRCKKGIESKEGPMNNKNISEAKQYLEKYLLENPELFKYQYGKDNVEEVLKELIEENPNWYKKFSSKKWTICEADGTPLGKVTASSELDAKVKFGIEHPEYAYSQSISAKEICASNADVKSVYVYDIYWNDRERELRNVLYDVPYETLPSSDYIDIEIANVDDYDSIKSAIGDALQRKYDERAESFEFEIKNKKINAQYEQTTNTKEPYPNPSETPHDDIVLENHDGWVNTAEQKVTPEFAQLHSILGEYKKNGHILSITQDGKDLLVSCSPIASYEMKQKFEQLGYECEETDESETGDAYDLPSYTLRIKMK